MLAMLLEDQINWQDNISAGIENGKIDGREKGITEMKQRT